MSVGKNITFISLWKYDGLGKKRKKCFPPISSPQIDPFFKKENLKDVGEH